jgi:hypothetical protein
VFPLFFTDPDHLAVSPAAAIGRRLKLESPGNAVKTTKANVARIDNRW